MIQTIDLVTGFQNMYRMSLLLQDEVVCWRLPFFVILEPRPTNTRVGEHVSWHCSTHTAPVAMLRVSFDRELHAESNHV